MSCVGSAACFTRLPAYEEVGADLTLSSLKHVNASLQLLKLITHVLYFCTLSLLRFAERRAKRVKEIKRKVEAK